MNIAEKLLAPFRRGGRGVSAEEGVDLKRRRTTALPAVFRQRTNASDALPKRSPENLRRMAELPIARKAINTIKPRIRVLSQVPHLDADLPHPERMR